MGKAYLNGFSHIYYYIKKGVKQMKHITKFSYWNPILCMKIEAVTDNDVIASLFKRQLIDGNTILHVGCPIINDETGNNFDDAYFLKIKRSVINQDVSVIASDLMMIQFEDRMLEMILSNKGKFKKSALLAYIGLQDMSVIESYTEAAISIINGTCHRKKGVDYIMLANTFKPIEMTDKKRELDDMMSYYPELCIS